MRPDRYLLADRRKARNKMLGTVGIVLMALGTAACVAYAVLYL